MPRSDIHDHPALDMSIKDVEEKRAKREIANMNERRRMQNINSGFHSLRGLLPQKHDGEKLSKAAILQHTTNYIYQLEREVASLLSQNSELKRLVGGSAASVDTNTPEWIKRFASQPPDCPSCKRRKYESTHRQDIDSSPLGGDGSSTESSSEQEMKFRPNRSNKLNGKLNDQSLRKQLNRIEKQLEEERRIRSMLEDEINYQNKSTNQNGRHYHSVLDPVADEVEIASESIEIEMHSCPASPPEVISMANCDQTSSGTGSVYLSNQHSTGISPHIEVSHKLLEQQQQRVQKQNAIALPIDVPFVAPREIAPENCDNASKSGSNVAANSPLVVLFDSNCVSLFDSSKIQTTSNTITGTSNSVPQIFHLMSNGSDTKGNSTLRHSDLITTNTTPIMSSQKAENSLELAMTSRQNLNSIVEAIRHLEGDHLFDSSDKVAKESPLKLKKEFDEPHVVHITQQNMLRDSNESVVTKQESESKAILDSLATGAPYSTASIVTSTPSIISSGVESQPRPQIIQVSRPNVIVAHTVEN